MGARDPQELAVWRLAHELKLEVYAITARPAVKRDFDFCDQIRRAASSAEENITEGFWRYSHGDFARFLIIARASLGEVRNQLRDAVDRRHLDQPECDRLSRLAARGMIAAMRLHTYLKTHPTPQFTK